MHHQFVTYNNYKYIPNPKVRHLSDKYFQYRKNIFTRATLFYLNKNQFNCIIIVFFSRKKCLNKMT